MVVTIAERKARKIAHLETASQKAVAALRSYAIEAGGRYLIFGSFARGDFRSDSDFDVVVDFPPALQRVWHGRMPSRSAGASVSFRICT